MSPKHIACVKKTLLMGWCIGAFTAVSPVMAQQHSGSKALLVGQLINDARAAGRNVTVPTPLAAREALTLLNMARRLNPNSLTVLRLQADAAEALRNYTVAQKSLLSMVALNPKNLTAQVRFIDDLAASRQTVQQRINVYMAALDGRNLNPQVSSAIALRASRLLASQSRQSAAWKMLTLAVKFNPANLAALQDMAAQLVGKQASPQRQLKVLLRILHADPYQPSVVAAVSRLLAQAGDYRLAATWMDAAISQYQRADVPISSDVSLALAQDWAIAGEYPQFNAFSRELLAMKNVSTHLLMLALAAHSQGRPVDSPGGVELLGRVQSRLTALAKAHPKVAEFAADKIWLNLYYGSTVPTDIAVRIAAWHKLVPASESLYQRLIGWQLLREKKYHSAKIALQTAGLDPYARIGLAWLAVQQGDRARAGFILQKLWAHPPSSLLALDVAQAARQLQIKLHRSPAGEALAGLVEDYPSHILNAVDHPSRVVLVTTSWSHRMVDYGQPLYLKVHFFNATGHTLAVGPGTAVTTAVALAGQIDGLHTVNLGVYAVDENPEVMQLGSQSTLTVRYRVDQGPLMNLVWNNPNSLIGGNIEIITNPVADHGQMAPGLGGQELSAGYFNIRGFCGNSLSEFARVARELPTLTGQKAMLAAGVLVVQLPRLRQMAAAVPAQPAEAGASLTPAKLRRLATSALLQVLSQPENSLVQAWIVRQAPLAGLPAKLQKAILSLKASSHPLIRMMCYRWMMLKAELARTTGPGTAIARALALLAHKDSSKLAAHWADLLSQQAAIKPPKVHATTQATKDSGPSSESGTALNGTLATP